MKVSGSDVFLCFHFSSPQWSRSFSWPTSCMSFIHQVCLHCTLWHFVSTDTPLFTPAMFKNLWYFRGFFFSFLENREPGELLLVKEKIRNQEESGDWTSHRGKHPASRMLPQLVFLIFFENMFQKTSDLCEWSKICWLSLHPSRPLYNSSYLNLCL